MIEPRPNDALRLDQRLNAATAVAPRTDYLGLTKTLSYSFIFVMPLFILYEVGMLGLTAGFGTNVRIGADVFLRKVLALVGIDSTLVFGLLVMVAGLVILGVERRRGIRLNPRWFLGMFGESLAYAIVVGLAVSTVISAVLSFPPLQLEAATTRSLAEGLVLSLGAGLYEELLFRLILVTGLFALLRLIPISTFASYSIAAVIGAIIFSWVHYLGPLGDAFEVSSFAFRALMGLALNGLFLWRGFGIAAMTHALYDVLVTLFV